MGGQKIAVIGIKYVRQQQKLVMYYQINNHDYLKQYVTSKELETIYEIFPPSLDAEDQIMQEAANSYDSKNPYHVMLLQQRCFQAPNSQIFRIYNAIRKKHHPDLEPPRISLYYHYDSFVKMEKIFEWIESEGSEVEYPSLEKTGCPQVPKILKYLNDQYSYIPNLERQLLYYPSYLAKLQNQRATLFNGIHVTLQHAYFCSIIIALQAACPYIACRYANKFIIKGGNSEWLKSIENQPSEIRPFRQIFRKLIRQPWKITIDDFTFCKESGFWNTIKAINYSALTVYVNTVCTLALAVGAVPEEPCPYLQLDKMMDVKKKHDGISCPTNKEQKMALAEQIKRLGSQIQKMGKSELEELQRKQILPYMKSIGPEIKKQTLYKETIAINHNLLQPHNEILKGSNEVPPLPCMHAEKYLQAMVHRIIEYRCDIVENFFKKSNFVKKMTYSNFGKDQNSNTEEFRRSIRMFTEKMLGYTRNESTYRDKVRKNPQLTMPLKFYARLLALCPAYVNQQVIRQINHESGWIECFDLGHLAVLITETKARCNMTTLIFCVLEA